MNLPAIVDRVTYLTQRSVALLWANVPEDGKPYRGAFSGGKDSCVIKELAKIAGVPVEWHYSVTTLDPPELIRFIKKHHPDVIFDVPKQGFFRRAVEKGEYPSRKVRWCCAEYKEFSPDNSTIITGVRIHESPRRSRVWTSCLMVSKANKTTKILMPVRLWKTDDVWSFIHNRNIPYCELYDQGFKRLGCIGCPLATKKQREDEFRRWPNYERRWRKMFNDIWANRAGTITKTGKEWFGSRYFDSPDQLFEWWNDRQPNITKWRKKHGLIVKI